MDMYISHQSALEYWRNHRLAPHRDTLRSDRVSLPGNPPATRQIKGTGLTLPVHVMLGNPKGRWQSKTMKQHVLSGQLPACCFVEVGEGLYVSSPEYCFMQMAGSLDFAQLVELGYELCGTYTLSAGSGNSGAQPVSSGNDNPNSGFYNHQPLTDLATLAGFLALMRGSRGHRKATRALRYMIEGSASPMETKLSMLLTLPYRLGGFGLAQPKLNSRINPSKSARRYTGKDHFVCDLFWPDYNLAVEYDSDQFHTGSERISDDSSRRNALALMGIVTITVTRRQIRNRDSFEKAAKVVAHHLEKRMAYQQPAFAKASIALRNLLF